MHLPKSALDPSVEILTDDRGWIVLLPDDHRNPVRLDPSDRPLIDWLVRADDVSADSVIPGISRERVARVLRSLEEYGMIAGRQSRSETWVYESPMVARIFSWTADTLTRPLRALSIDARGRMLWIATGLLVILVLGLWGTAGGRVFAEVINPYWWVAVVLYVGVVPFVHEFSHAFVARLFGFEVTSVGVAHRGGLSYSPFVGARYAVLSSNPVARVWLPLIGVVCDLMMLALVTTGVIFLSADSAAGGTVGTLVLLLHVRLLLDISGSKTSDATQALQYSRDFDRPGRYWRLRAALRGSYAAFAVATLSLLALSAGSRFG